MSPYMESLLIDLDELHDFTIRMALVEHAELRIIKLSVKIQNAVAILGELNPRQTNTRECSVIDLRRLMAKPVIIQRKDYILIGCGCAIAHDTAHFVNAYIRQHSQASLPTSGLGGLRYVIYSIDKTDRVFRAVRAYFQLTAPPFLSP